MNKVPRFCNVCGSALVAGEFARYASGYTVCNECEDTKPRCSVCRVPSQQLRAVGRLKVCPRCRAEMPVCTSCQIPIWGSYYSSPQDASIMLCPNCFQTAPRCEGCNLPSRQLQQVRGKSLCPSCRSGMLLCALCQVPILGKYNYRGTPPRAFCAACLTGYPSCDLCQSPVDAHGWVQAQRDGEVRRCSTCFAAAVTGNGEAQRHYQEAWRLVQRELGLELPSLPRLEVVDRATLLEVHRDGEILKGGQAPVTPANQHLLGFFERTSVGAGYRMEIWILEYLPRALYYVVAAHEQGHAWQSFNASIKQQAPMIVEGFCDWVGWHVMKAQGEIAQAAAMTRGDSEYAEGLRYFITLEMQQGIQGVLQRARSV